MLHIVAPGQPASSPLLLQLASVAMRQMPNTSQSVLVLGSESDVRACRAMGLQVLGSIGGVLDVSQTLQQRVCKYVQNNFSFSEKLIAWGFEAMVSTNRCSEQFEVFAIVDEVDCLHASHGLQTCVPTSPCCAETLHSCGIPQNQITEPIIAVEPCALLVGKATVLEILEISDGEFVVSIVGHTGAWQEIAAMAVRLHFAKIPVCFVVPSEYKHRDALMIAVRERGVSHLFTQIPSELRQIDVLHAATCAWSPTNARSDRTCGVLEVLEAASVEVPLAVSTCHPVSTIPSIGSSIAWASTSVEVAGWMIALHTDETSQQISKSVSRVSAVRASTTQGRFIENILLRTSQACRHSL
ncbi:MAG: hypothetical protein ACI9JK_000740 [Phycisphaerales bacterium]|jgi:hypothetical protein